MTVGSPASASDMLDPPSLERKPSFSTEVSDADEFDSNRLADFGKAFVAYWLAGSGRSSIANGLACSTKPLPPEMFWTLRPMQVFWADKRSFTHSTGYRSTHVFRTLHDGEKFVPRFTSRLWPAEPANHEISFCGSPHDDHRDTNKRKKVKVTLRRAQIRRIQSQQRAEPNSPFQLTG